MGRDLRLFWDHLNEPRLGVMHGFTPQPVTASILIGTSDWEDW
jgi:hypothetical protein